MLADGRGGARALPAGNPPLPLTLTLTLTLALALALALALTLTLTLQGLLGALHTRLAAAPPAYVAYAVASGLSQVFSSLGDGVAPTYATFMPMLRARFEAAVNANPNPNPKPNLALTRTLILT